MPKLSVLMSVYNDNKFLSEAVVSVLNQSFSDFEFVIFDDGSTDGSGKILDEYAIIDNRIKVIHQENEGLTKTLNSGIKMARGEYIARMDADDISLPERLKEQIAYLDANPDIALVSSFAKIIDDKGREIGKHEPAISHDAIRKLSFFSGQLCHPAVMFRKSAVEMLGGYNEKFIYAQDAELWFRLMKRFKVANLPKFLFYWRKTASGIGIAKKKQQRRFVQKAKVAAIKDGLYPRYYFVFLIWPYLRQFVPLRLKEIFKRKI